MNEKFKEHINLLAFERYLEVELKYEVIRGFDVVTLNHRRHPSIKLSALWLRTDAPENPIVNIQRDEHTSSNPVSRGKEELGVLAILFAELVRIVSKYDPRTEDGLASETEFWGMSTLRKIFEAVPQFKG